MAVNYFGIDLVGFSGRLAIWEEGDGRVIDWKAHNVNFDAPRLRPTDNPERSGEMEAIENAL